VRSGTNSIQYADDTLKRAHLEGQIWPCSLPKHGTCGESSTYGTFCLPTPLICSIRTLPNHAVKETFRTTIGALFSLLNFNVHSGLHCKCFHLYRSSELRTRTVRQLFARTFLKYPLASEVGMLIDAVLKLWSRAVWVVLVLESRLEKSKEKEKDNSTISFDSSYLIAEGSRCG
jgi:hypothetical protein